MNWKSFFLGLGVGVISGFATKQLLDAKTYVSPEKALANAKELFKQSGPISGSWIQMKAEPYENHNLTYTVYKGGISRFTDDSMKQYEFIADAATGSIIETKEIS
ncbi:PepSY domain-containing protein [Robertmurraya massiliosenegalensis]|uniref:PepSY domain-containing protein n=1 Tax=Robertmurraya massiliosenegalensis TaxID=1287657 RepID=UPI000304B447|nr:PepSY domain-containing protein [Robertmurraya massiliosenegalensis]